MRSESIRKSHGWSAGLCSWVVQRHTTALKCNFSLRCNASAFLDMRDSQTRTTRTVFTSHYHEYYSIQKPIVKAVLK